MVSGPDGADSTPVIKASQEKKDTPLTELIMKDPTTDFSPRHQLLVYYKCHLHTVLENGEEGGWGGGQGRKERKTCG